MIVVDTNVLANLYLPGTFTAEARQALVRDSAWAAPLLWRSEFRNVLVTAVRTSRLVLADGIVTMGVALDLMVGREYDLDSAAVLRLAAESGCSAYDCEFVALAQDLGVPLVTAHRLLLARFRGTAVSLRDFAAGGRPRPAR